MPIPEKLQRIVDRFASAPRELKGQALLKYAQQLPALPADLTEARDRMQQVHECQTPFFLEVRVEDDGTVRLFFDCPPEAPTVRGFAGILVEGLDGEDFKTVLDVPNTFYTTMGLEDVVSPMRLRGMQAILAGIKRRVGERLEGSLP